MHTTLHKNFSIGLHYYGPNAGKMKFLVEFIFILHNNNETKFKIFHCCAYDKNYELQRQLSNMV